MNEIERFAVGNITAVIYYDPEPINPRKDWDGQLAILVCWHRRMKLGDKTLPEGCSEEELRENVDEEILAILPLYLYDHSGITMSTKPFGCSWDSEQVGWSYITRASVKANGCEHLTQEELFENIRSEVQSYDAYLRGECYGFEVLNSDGEVIEALWGFLGDLEGCCSEAKSSAKYHAG
jgi:hypothetical protein